MLDDIRLIALDFETTWLDYKTDEIVQVWIVEFDLNAREIDSFKSFVKPGNKKIDSIFTYITWFDESHFLDAPSISDIWHKIRSFFDEKTVIIWHNIWFDIDFLLKYFPDISYKDSIDTYDISRNFIHFPASYSLEVLCQTLQEDKKFLSLCYDIWLPDMNIDMFHDAFYDAKYSAALFVYIHDYIKQLIIKYPQIQTLFHKTQALSLFYRLFEIGSNGLDQNKITIPTINKSVTTPTTLSYSPDTIKVQNLENLTNVCISDQSSKAIAQYIAQQKNVIAVFSQKNKMDIMRHHLHDMWVYGLGSLYEDRYFDNKRLSMLIKKQIFTEQEILFLLKYFSHHHQNKAIFDVQFEYEKNILYFLQSSKAQWKVPIVFSTHYMLYQELKTRPERYKDYTIMFFDQDRWYMTYNNFSSNTYNPYDFLQTIEKILYSYDICHQSIPSSYSKKYDDIKKFYSFLQIFIWVLFIDSQKIFDNKADFTQIEPIVGHHLFYNTKKLREQLLARQEYLSQHFPTNIIEDIEVNIFKLKELLNSIIIIHKNSDYSWNIFFTYSLVNRFVQRDEFIELFKHNHTILFSYQKNEKSISLFDESDKSSLEIVKSDNTTIIKHIKESILQHDTVFVLSSAKNISQKLFQDLCNSWLTKEYLVLAENITWWAGKNIFIAHKSTKKIIIWSYSFILQCVSSGIAIDFLLVFFIKWSMENLILRDIKLYASK